MIKGHITGCGLHGYRLVVFVLTGPSNRVVFVLLFKLLFPHLPLVCFIVSVFSSCPVKDYIELV